MTCESVTPMDVFDDIVAHFEAAPRAMELVRKIERPAYAWQRFKALRDLYRMIEGDGYDPYPYGLDWSQVMTPIELGFWQDIRSQGIDMWPQYPVGRYFADFADPEHKVIVECDGKHWHDQARDEARDEHLAEMGWTVFRLSGAECLRTSHPMDEREPADWGWWLDNTSTGFLAALAVAVYGAHPRHYSADQAMRAVMLRCTNDAAFMEAA